MFVLCVLYSKGQKAQPGQSGQRSGTDEVQRTKSGVTGDFVPKLPTEPYCALGSTQPLKMSTRILLGVKTAGA